MDLLCSTAATVGSKMNSGGRICWSVVDITRVIEGRNHDGAPRL